MPGFSLIVSPSTEEVTALAMVSKGASRLPSFALSPFESTYHTGPRLTGPQPAPKHPINAPAAPPPIQDEFSLT